MRKYKGLVFTNHALHRLSQRGISQGDVWATWHSPDNSRYAKSRGAWVYHRAFGSTRIEVVAKQNEYKEWVVLSVWSKQVYRKERRALDSILLKLLRRIF